MMKDYRLRKQPAEKTAASYFLRLARRCLAIIAVVNLLFASYAAALPVTANGETSEEEYGDRYNKYFYWDNVARDSRAPFTDGESYARYLADEYIEAEANKPGSGMGVVEQIWKKYLYDIYDPMKDLGNVQNDSDYPDYTYGDQYPSFVKDNGSSFHAGVTPVVRDLSYDYLDDNVDYTNFVSNLKKTATADAAGDANDERRFNIDLYADAQAKSSAPVAMILQIQTSWQMFDMLHANALKGEGHTENGSSSYNTQMANLYDIKQRSYTELCQYPENDHQYCGSSE